MLWFGWILSKVGWLVGSLFSNSLSYHMQRPRKINYKPRIKLNHNMYILYLGYILLFVNTVTSKQKCLAEWRRITPWKRLVEVTVLFINMQIVKFKSQLMFVFFTAINHLSGPLRKQKFTSTVSKGHGLWLWLVDFDPFCVFLCFKVHCLWS